METRTHTAGAAARFSAAARTYDSAAEVQEAVAGKLTRFLEGMPYPHWILDVGCGTGLLTGMVAQKYEYARIEAIDVSRALIDVARRRFHDNTRIRFSAANALAFESRIMFDLIVSSSSFHWMVPLEQLFSHMASLLAPAGRMAFAMMTDGTLAELKASRKRIVPAKPVNARLPSVAQVRSAAAAARFRLVREELDSMQTAYSSVTEFLYSIHNVGVTGGGYSTSGSLLTRGELSRLIGDYVKRNSTPNGGVFATYRVLYGIAEHISAGAAAAVRLPGPTPARAPDHGRVRAPARAAAKRRKKTTRRPSGRKRSAGQRRK